MRISEIAPSLLIRARTAQDSAYPKVEIRCKAHEAADHEAYLYVRRNVRRPLLLSTEHPGLESEHPAFRQGRRRLATAGVVLLRRGSPNAENAV